MKQFAAVLGAGVLLSGGVAQAQTDLESKLTMTLTINVEEDTNEDDELDSTKISKVRFATKDFIDVMKDVLDNEDLKTVVLQRENVDDETGFPSSILDQTLMIRESDGDEVDPVDSGNFLATAIDLDDVGAGLGDNSVQADKDDADDGVVKSRILTNEGATWIIDVDGDAGSVDEGATTTDQIVLDLFGTTQLNSRQVFDGDTSLGTWANARSATVFGGADIDDNAAFDDVSTEAVTGVVAGKIKASTEKEQDDNEVAGD
jgi:hypothetical protein